MKPSVTLAVILFVLVALLHFVRLILGVEVLADGVSIPMWVSIGGILVPLAAALFLVTEARKSGGRESER